VSFPRTKHNFPRPGLELEMLDLGTSTLTIRPPLLPKEEGALSENKKKKKESYGSFLKQGKD